MDFVVGLPYPRKQNDSIWVIVDRLNKSAHFVPVKRTYSSEDYVMLYLSEDVSLHGVPVLNISDRGLQFTSWLWKAFKRGLGIKVKLSTSFHPQLDCL